ncbi:MAG: response regulator [Candidatus Omnitrophota bacterium]|nr:response regulator [Candidatus Omnitrophota bacterium]MBU1929081.1 response regulator [Candidatus Omnitrophota bacterium]MBU1929168.1 response regulator [Candidatus Omnitrophota bacterium]MBU2035048.1 response regulator [Candidatus Omnitrophota bacterium]MBU2222122.1 response regulator [Candidatus Omnitrophota bacterium]
MAKVVMVVDDSKMSREVIRMSLEKADYQVILAENGEQAIDKLKTDNKVDLIILDLVLPGLDGFGVLCIIKNDPVLKNIPVIIFTNRESEADRQEALELGAIDVMVKHRESQDDLVKYIKQLIQ